MKWYTVKDRWLPVQMTYDTDLVIKHRLFRHFMSADRVWVSEDKKQLRFESHLGTLTKEIKL